MAISIAQFLIALVLKEIIKTLLAFLKFKLYLERWEFFPIPLGIFLKEFICKDLISEK